jgi:hypothetical protein
MATVANSKESRTTLASAPACAPIEVYFDRNCYPNGCCLFIAPRARPNVVWRRSSGKYTNPFRIDLVQNNLKYISVDRRLKPKRLRWLHFVFFPSIDMHFVCDSITLRRLIKNKTV